MNLSAIALIVQLIGMELLLSVDQVAIIGARVKELPDTLMGTGGTTRIARWFSRLRRQVVVRVFGLGFAVVIRIIALLAASWLIHYPVIRLVGGGYLIVMGLKHLAKPDQQGEEQLFQHVRASSFWGTVMMIGLLDGIFAIDNVLTSVGLSQDIGVILIGGIAGIITLFFGSGYAITLMNKEPRYEAIAYVLVLQIGALLVFETLEWTHIGQWAKIAMSLTVITVITAYIRFPVISTVFGECALTIGQFLGNLYEIVHNGQLVLTCTVTLRFRDARVSMRELVWNIPETVESVLRLMIGVVRIPKRIRAYASDQPVTVNVPVE